MARLSRQMRVSRPVRLLESALTHAPIAIGWLRPVILLPATALTGLTPPQLEALLAHELAHIRRYDYLVNLIQTVVETLLFYHPAVHWVSQRIRLEREACCDDLAVAVSGDSLVYARALATMEELRHAPPRVAMAAHGGVLMQRIRRIVGLPGVEHCGRAGWLEGAFVLAGLVAAAVIVYGCTSSPPSARAPQSGNANAPETTPAEPRAVGLVEKPFALDAPTKLNVVAGPAEQRQQIRATQIVFARKNDQLQATLSVRLVSWPKAEYRIGVALLADNGKVLRQEWRNLAASGAIAGRPGVGEHKLEYSFGPWADVEKAVRFRVAIERLSEVASPAGATDTP